MNKITLTTDDQNTLMGEAMDATYERLGYDDSNAMWEKLCGEPGAWPHHTTEFSDAGFQTLSNGNVVYSSDNATEDDARRYFLNLCEDSLSNYMAMKNLVDGPAGNGSVAGGTFDRCGS